MEALKETLKKIDDEVKANNILLYMKGDRTMPRCGFSAQVVQILNSLQVEYETRDVLADQNVREAVKQYSEWPTLPQLYVKGEFVGGCDIVTEMYQNGELQDLVGIKS
ncbi:MAG: Grx4 family monothiol glutaredoxin [Leptospiraceae bacterium]|nr:Grx4 family monothiol glutaredoxin [Leptospiraceae bacterium]